MILDVKYIYLFVLSVTGLLVVDATHKTKNWIIIIIIIIGF
jgi:hypothetical protein